MNFVKFGNSKKFIVFLHGWACDMWSFLWIKDFFQEDYSLLFIDFKGFGKSQEPLKSQSLNDYVYDLKDLIDSFELDELILVGHSFGGRVAIKFLFFYQNFYKKTALCLIDSAGILPKRNLFYYFNVARYKRMKKKSKLHPRYNDKLSKFGSSDYRKLSPVMKETFVKIVNEDLSFFAKHLKCKTIIIWGAKDKETKPYMARKLKKIDKWFYTYFF